MKRLVAVSSLFALALTAFAQTSGDQQVVVPALKEAQIQRSYMSPGDFARYNGSYELSNGKTLYLTRKATRMWAQVDEQTPHEITGSSSGKFQALNGNMAMHLVFAADDTVSGELHYIDETQKSVAGLPLQATHVTFAAR